MRSAVADLSECDDQHVFALRIQRVCDQIALLLEAFSRRTASAELTATVDNRNQAEMWPFADHLRWMNETKEVRVEIGCSTAGYSMMSM